MGNLQSLKKLVSNLWDPIKREENMESPLWNLFTGFQILRQSICRAHVLRYFTKILDHFLQVVVLDYTS